MKSILNTARQRLEKGELAIGVGIRHSRSVAIAKIMKTAGYDFLFIDLEHSTMPADTATQISLAALDAGIAPLVRVPEKEDGLAVQVLNGGAMGVIMPHIDTAEEAKAVVSSQKFPPVGNRSVGGALAQFDYGHVNMKEATRQLNEQSLVIVQLETELAIANADSIAAVDGVDVLMIGVGDLTAEMGIQGQSGHARVVAAFETVVTACKKHGKWVGMGGVEAEDLVAKYIALGVRFHLFGNDISLMLIAGRQKTDFMRSCK